MSHIASLLPRTTLLHNRKGGGRDFLGFSTSSIQPKTEGRIWQTSPGSPPVLELWVLECN